MLIISVGFPGGTSGKESTRNAGETGDVGSIPGSRRSPGGRNGTPLQYSYLENFIGRGTWQAAVHGAVGGVCKFLSSLSLQQKFEMADQCYSYVTAQF